eukprot:CAMPEP_0170650794 /NCGR_PEP_ID=MMETSP0224-20130122/46004_1 /TAXON_ID=285029 /ORGANISM="Togula jolla, Strain CCCM 725" /LENGTH=1241 /DNA_ID=CAMNT_0010982503 /DNA_START=117 /DNA_END=3842 /DNA_ORIENTATION=+
MEDSSPAFVQPSTVTQVRRPLSLRGGQKVPDAAHASDAGYIRFAGSLFGSVLGMRILSSEVRRMRARRNCRSTKTQRRFLQTMVENMNPFAEKPEEETRKKYQGRVEEINALEEAFKAKSDDDLRALTEQLRERAVAGEDLQRLLPEAFAVVREASARVLDLRHFDVQLIGGMALHEGNIAEMGTGEGKTLVAILPAFLNALSGKGVHVVTVNDYLARRDAEWVGQPLRFLGLSVGVIQGGMSPEQHCDVTYVTNSELGFDYLRDQLAGSPSDLGLREKEPFQFAIVDEVDSILIDEARTPLIISGQASQPSSKYEAAREVARTLRKTVHYEVDEKQKNCVLIEAGIESAEKLLGKDDLFDPSDPWFPFIINALNAKEIYIKNKSYIVKKKEVVIVDEFTGRVMEGRRWSNGLHQAVEAKEGVPIQAESVTLASISYQSLFRQFKKLAGMTGTAFTEAKEFEEIYKLKTVVVPPNRQRSRQDKDDQVYVDDIGKWKAVARDIENSHRIGRPVLIGTTNVENSEIVAELLDALDVPYKLLNAKPENVARETEIVASSGRKYSVTIATNMAGRGTDILLGGNSGMMARIYLRYEIFTRLFPQRDPRPWKMPADFFPVELPMQVKEQVKSAAAFAVKAWSSSSSETPTTLDAAERLVETEVTELEAEERLSLACEQSPCKDEALLRLREAYQLIVSQFKQVTDLEKQEVIALGGLSVLGTERHESRRIDNQLRGRCARQGDPGNTRFFLSLNDSIFRIFGGEQIKKIMNMMSFTETDDTPLESGLLSNSLEEAQKKVENYFYSVRKSVFEYDDVMDTQRQIVYGLRRRALLDIDENIKGTLLDFSDNNMGDFVLGHCDVNKPVSTWFFDKLAENLVIYCSMLKDITPEALKEAAGNGGEDGIASLKQYLQEKARAALELKLEEIDASSTGLAGMIQRQILLMQLDQYWQQHLKNMDFLKTGVTLRAYGQKNPLTEYKLEGYQVFLKMMSRIRRNTVYNLFLFTPRKLTPMTKERVQSLLAGQNRDSRRKEIQEVKKELANEGKAVIKPIQGSQSVGLAKLALNLRQLLEARQDLQDLALASFSELRDAFARAGLIAQGDQLRWASSCADFELVEDELNQEIYIGLKDRGTPDPEARKARIQAQESMQTALENPEFVQSIDQFTQQPSAFLAMMKEAASEQGWTSDDVARMRTMYRLAGIDIDQMLKEMSESPEELPEGQLEVVQFMKKLLDEADQKKPADEVQA